MAAGEKILRLRKEKGWSQQLVAQKIGTSGPIIGRYERGEMVPSVEVARKLADVFGVTLDYLVDDTGRVAEIKDRTMLNRLMDLEQLDQDDRKTILRVLDSLIRDAKARKAYEAQRPHRPEDTLQAVIDGAMMHAIQDGENSGAVSRRDVFKTLEG
ncbi:MAG: helix-turn-helix domain-containing protein [Desulfobulbaceae bacterium]